MRVPVRIEQIRRGEALRYLGWKGECKDANVLSQIKDAECLALDHAVPAVLIQRFLLSNSLMLEGTDFAPHGSHAAALLSGCKEAALLAATLGMSSERLLLRIQSKSPSLALVLDAVLTAMIEQVCDEACRLFEDQLRLQGLYLTPRFSPGYGDMPIEQTSQICAVLDTPRQIGLSVSSNGLMIPRKSVTAIIGVTTGVPSCLPTGCASCRMTSACNVKKSVAQGCAVTEV